MRIVWENLKRTLWKTESGLLYDRSERPLCGSLGSLVFALSVFWLEPYEELKLKFRAVRFLIMVQLSIDGFWVINLGVRFVGLCSRNKGSVVNHEG